jgi:hypothetical protein
MGMVLIHMGILRIPMGRFLIHVGIILIPMEIIRIPMGIILIPMGMILIHMRMILIHMGTLDLVLMAVTDLARTKHEKTPGRKLEIVRNRSPRKQVGQVRSTVVLAVQMLISLPLREGLEPRA